MFSSLKDQVVLVTGASGDIGRAIVKEFSKFKAKVYKTDIMESSEPYFIQGDISDQDFLKAIKAKYLRYRCFIRQPSVQMQDIRCLPVTLNNSYVET